MGSWTPLDVIVAVLAAAITFVLMFSIVEPLITHLPISEDKTELMSELLTAVIAMIALYIGANIKK